MRLHVVRAALGALVLTALTAGPAAGQETSQTSQRPQIAHRFGVSAAAGISWPVDGVVADVYGGMVPVTVQADARLFGHVALFAGFKSVQADGQTVVLGTPVADERYATSLRVSSLRLGAIVVVPVARRFALAGSAGVGVNWFGERWPEAQSTARGHATGIVVQAEMRYALHPRWTVLGRLEYAPFSTQAVGTSSAVGVNLGGLDLCAGIRLGF